MNTHYQAAVDGLRELEQIYAPGGQGSQAAALALVTIQASLAAAKAADDLLKAQETGNLIAFAQLTRQRRRVSLAVEELVNERMAALHPAVKEDLADDEDGY